MVGTLVMAGVLLAGTPSAGQSFLNEHLAQLLGGEILKVEEVKEGTKVPLHSLIATSALWGVFEQSASGRTGDLQPDGFVTITWKRDEMDKHFVASLLEESSAVRMFHPFVDRGIETVLREESFSITLHDGMLLHLRNDMPSFTKLKTFASEKAVGIATEVRGKVFVSTDTEVIETKLATVWSDSLLCAGSIPRCILGDTCIQAPNGMYVATARKLRVVSCALRCIWGTTCFRKPDDSVEIKAVVTGRPPEYYVPRVE